MNAGAVAMIHGSNCSACVEGGVCPGGRAVLARAGWCEAGTVVVTGSTDAGGGGAGNEGVEGDTAGTVNAGARLFRHCCEPSQCPGGFGASCERKIALADGGECDVRLVSFETLHKLGFSAQIAYVAAFVLALLLLIGLCAGVAFGARLAHRRFERLERLSVYYSAAAAATLELLEDELPIGPWSGPLMPSLEIVAVEEAEPGALPPPREVKHLMPRLGLA